MVSSRWLLTLCTRWVMLDITAYHSWQLVTKCCSFPSLLMLHNSLSLFGSRIHISSVPTTLLRQEDVYRYRMLQKAKRMALNPKAARATISGTAWMADRWLLTHI